MFDITKLAASNEAFFQFKHPDTGDLIFADGAKKEPVGVVLYGPSSPQAIAIESDISNRNIGRVFKGKDTAEAAVTAETMRSEQIERLVARTKEFRNFAYPPAGDAKGDEFSHAVYSDRNIGWVQEQSAAWIGGWKGFLPK